MGICYMTQGTQTSPLWQPRGVGGEREGTICVYLWWFMWIYSKKQHNKLKTVIIQLEIIIKTNNKQKTTWQRHALRWDVAGMAAADSLFGHISRTASLLTNHTSDKCDYRWMCSYIFKLFTLIKIWKCACIYTRLKLFEPSSQAGWTRTNVH